MKKLCFLFAFVLMLAGCQAAPTFETTEDVYGPQPQSAPRQVALELPESVQTIAGEQGKLYLCDGLDGVEPEENRVTDICICGMGGELIGAIVCRSDYVKRRRTNLILQHMSSGYELRKALLEDGFVIREERLCQAAGRVYSCIRAEYTGEKTEYTEGQLLAGREMSRGDLLYPLWMERHKKALEKQIRGREAGGLDTTYVRAVLAEIETMECMG